jgi:hypothetical protein
MPKGAGVLPFRGERFELATAELTGHNNRSDGINRATLGGYQRTLRRLALAALQSRQVFSTSLVI